MSAAKMSKESIEVLRAYAMDLQGVMDLWAKETGEQTYPKEQCTGETVQAYAAILQAFDQFMRIHQSSEEKEKVQKIMWEYVCTKNKKK